MEMPLLNLLNFEQPPTACKYVLTSPRSLKACRKAGVKPVELLYRGPEELAEQLCKNDDVTILHEKHEKERQRKVDLCRSIRNYLIKREERKEAAAKEINNNVPDEINDLGKESTPPDFSLPPVEDAKCNSPMTLLNDICDEIEAITASETSPKTTTSMNEEASFPKAGQGKRRSVRICDKRMSDPGNRKQRGSRKILKITPVLQPMESYQHYHDNYIDPEYRIFKFQKVIDHSVERELRLQRAELMQRELELGLARWQDRVMVGQWAAVTLAHDRAQRSLHAKLARLKEASRIRAILHTHNLNKVKEAEDLRAEGLRKQVQYKDMKIQNLHQERERIIFESRCRAQSVSDLRQQIRDIMTPETFDQKVSKYSLESRVLNGATMSPLSMQRSHFFLG